MGGATSGGRSRVAAIGFVIAALLAAAGIWFGWAAAEGTDTVRPTPFGITVLLALAFLSYAAVGALIARRAHDHPIGWLLLTAGLLFEAGLAAENFAKHRAVRGDADVWSAAASWLDAWAWGLALGLVLLALVLFPDPRPTNGRDRWLLVVVAGASLLQAISAAVTPGPLGSGSRQTNPLGLASLAGAIDAVAAVSGAVVSAAAVVTVTVLVLRYRRAEGDRRQQLRWLALAAAIAVGSLVVAFLGQLIGLELEAIAFVTLVVVLPVAIAIAILRYRLYDIDLVVNRLLLYGSLTVVITLIYVGVTAAAGELTNAPPDSAVSVVAAVAVAVAVLPARRRLQALADRIVFGRRATPYQALAGFAEHMVGTPSIDDLAPRLAGLLGDATGAEVAVVYLRVDDELVPVASRPVERDLAAVPLAGRAAEFGRWDDSALVEQHEQLLGALALKMPPGAPVREDDRRILRHLAAQAAVAFETLRLNAELRGSRQRLVEAQELERRRIGRDLHDGAQQDLVALIAKAMLARRQLVRDPNLADATLQELQADVRNALTELRGLAHGVFPQLLADRGLVAAVNDRAARCPVPTSVDAGTGTDRRFDPAVEGAAWFVVSEALTNVVKHANAERVTIRIRATIELDIEVVDDGTGLTNGSKGSGLVGMADRVGALGGWVRVEPAVTGGTVVRCSFPLANDRVDVP